MYYLAKGSTEWKATATALDANATKYFRQIPAPNGFEGYIYFPFNETVTYNVKCESAVVEYVYAQMVSNEGDVEMSSWMGVKSFNPANAFANIENEKCINMLTGDAYTSGNQGGNQGGNEGGNQGGNEGGNQGGNEGGNEGGNQGGNEGGETPETQPDYKVPAYTGAAIDYTDLSINKVTVGKLNAVVTVGSAIPEAAARPAKDTTITAVESKVGITKYPSFKVNSTSVSFTLDKEVSPKNPDSIIQYIELPAGKEATVTIQYNFYNKDDQSYYNFIYSGTCGLMAVGETEWTETAISAYAFKLPAGFKGYVKFNTNKITSQSNSPAGNTDTFKADTEKYLRTYNVKFDAGITAADDVYLSTPILVTKTGVIPYAAFVDGEENAARNIFTGTVLTRDDLSDFAGESGSGDLNQGEVPEIDYRIPAYTGAEETYGNYLFARIKQLVLGANIAKGYVIPNEAFEDGHADKKNDYTKLVDSTIGISKMPFFSVTKSTGNPSENNVSVGTWHPKKAEQANANAGALLQYIKLPSDLEKAFVGIYMNAYDKDFMAKNIAPYSGTVYYMEKGTTEWQTAKITAYWFELPKGFEGYVMFDAKTLKAQNGGDEWAADWTLYNWTLRVANLNNQTVVASAPFWADSVGDIDYACWLNDETKAVRDIFTGKVLKKDDIIKPLQIGDTIVKLPDYTTEFSVGFTDESALSNGTLMLEWDAIDNAAKYTVRVFKKTNTDDGIAYTLFMAEDTAETSITMEGLDLNTQYAVVVYAYNAKNDEIAVFDYINASTAGGGSTVTPVKPVTPNSSNKKPVATEEEEEGLSQTAIILIIVGAVVLVLAAAAVVTILLIKKRRARA